MKIKNVLMVIVGAIVALYCCYKMFDCPEHDKHSTDVRIAIFQPVTHPALDEIAQGFIDTMQDGARVKFRFDRYNGNGNKILMQAQTQEILQNKYDLIVTIGAGCSFMMKEASIRKGNTTPIVFTAIDDVERVDMQTSVMTGVVYDINYRKQLELLLAIQPEIKTVLLAYDQSQGLGLEKDRNMVESILQDMGVCLQCVEIATIGEIQQKVAGYLDAVDVVMILKDNLMVSGIDSLVKLARKYHVPVLASDLNSSDKGAVLAYGVYEYECGVYAAHQAKKIMYEHLSPAELAVLIVNDSKMVINCDQVQAQGLHINCDTFAMADVVICKKGSCHA